MFELIADYGIQGLSLLLLGIGLVLTRWVFPLVANKYASGVLERAWTEVKAAVLEIGQTYVDGIKAGRADGKLTGAEKVEAKLKAINKAKEYIGAKGLRTLARVAGVDADKWLGDKTEAAVGLLKSGAKKAAPVELPPDPSER
jgi:hypothetical protein